MCRLNEGEVLLRDKLTSRRPLLSAKASYNNTMPQVIINNINKIIRILLTQM